MDGDAFLRRAQAETVKGFGGFSGVWISVGSAIAGAFIGNWFIPSDGGLWGTLGGFVISVATLFLFNFSRAEIRTLREKLAKAEAKAESLGAVESVRWPLADLLQHLRPDLPADAGSPWNATLLVVQDEFATSDRLRVWGRPWRGAGESSLEPIPQSAWGRVCLHHWAADPAWRRGRHAHKRAHAEYSTCEYADIQVDKADALKIWPERGVLVPQWLNLSQTIEYLRHQSEWSPRRTGLEWALDLDNDLRALLADANGPQAMGRMHRINADRDKYAPSEREEISRSFWEEASFDPDMIRQWGGGGRRWVTNTRLGLTYDDLLFEYAGLTRHFPRRRKGRAVHTTPAEAASGGDGPSKSFVGRDTKLAEAVLYICSGEWGCEWNDDSVEYIAVVGMALKEFTQRAVDGEVNAWGRKEQNSGPHVPIPKSHWADHRVSWEDFCQFKFDTSPRDGGSSDRYFDVMVSREEFSRVQWTTRQKVVEDDERRAG